MRRKALLRPALVMLVFLGFVLSAALAFAFEGGGVGEFEEVEEETGIYTLNYDYGDYYYTVEQSLAFTGKIAPGFDPDERLGYSYLGYYYYLDDAGREFVVNPETTYSDVVGGDMGVLEAWIYAKFEPSAYFTIKYDLGDGIPREGEEEAFLPKTVLWDDDGLVPDEAPLLEGYTFKSWAYGGLSVDGDWYYRDVVGEDISITEVTLSAVWRSNDEPDPGEDLDSADPEEDLDPADPEKEDDSSEEEEPGEDVDEDDGGDGEEPRKDGLLDGYTVNYDLNGAESQNQGLFGPRRKVDWDDAWLLPSIDPKREGFVFGGWYYIDDEQERIPVGLDTPYSEIAFGDEMLTGVTLYVKWIYELEPGVNMQIELPPELAELAGSPSSVVTYFSSDETVAVVDAFGLLTARASGNTTITILVEYAISEGETDRDFAEGTDRASEDATDLIPGISGGETDWIIESGRDWKTIEFTLVVSIP